MMSLFMYEKTPVIRGFFYLRGAFVYAPIFIMQGIFPRRYGAGRQQGNLVSIRSHRSLTAPAKKR